MKRTIVQFKDKNRVISNIISAMAGRQKFLILGHKNPDEDCIASMVAFALIVKKFSKHVQIYIGQEIHEHFQYLLSICTYNSIELVGLDQSVDPGTDTLVLCDTPKPAMIEGDGAVLDLISREGVLKIEIDHHIGADSDYFGDEGYCLVTEASSAAELVGQLLLKLKCRKTLLQSFQINDLVSRNLVLAILTGIVGDSKMGLFLKSRRERRYYQIFSGMFNKLLGQKTVSSKNFSNMDEVFQAIQRLSDTEEKCFNFFWERRVASRAFSLVALKLEDTKVLYSWADMDTVVTVARAIADKLAEESAKLSLVAYYDNPENSDLVQFRIRRSQNYKEFDLRRILPLLNIENGGGHEGAIGFRIPRAEIADFQGFVQNLIRTVEQTITDPE